MAKTSWIKNLFHKPWFNLVLAVASLAAAYGFASWAINSGNLLTYAATLFCLTWAAHRLILGFHYKFHQ